MSTIIHRHKCSACGSPDRDIWTMAAFGGPFAHESCECPWPELDAICAERVPGARNFDCPSLAGLGCEDIIQLMLAETAAMHARARMVERFAAIHFGLEVAPALAGVSGREEEAWQFGEYLPARGV